MADLILVAATLAFVAICVGYVGWCDRIIGPDDVAGEVDPHPVESADVTADAEQVHGDGERVGVHA